MQLPEHRCLVGAETSPATSSALQDLEDPGHIYQPRPLSQGISHVCLGSGLPCFLVSCGITVSLVPLCDLL